MGWIRSTVVVQAFFALALHANAAHAQAVVEDKGSLGVTLSHDFGFADTIVESSGAEYPNVYINSQVTVLGVEYVPIDKLSISASLPLVGVKYDKGKSGSDYDPHGPYDDGKYHFTLQDLKADARYMVIGSPHAVAFNVGLTLPVADYPVQGSAAVGRHLVQGRLGVATSLAPAFLPGSFINLAYELTLSQKVDHSADTKKFGQTRSDVTASVGYFVRDDLGFFLSSALRLQHDGVDFIDYDMLTPDQKLYHDPILKEMALVLGAGGVYQINDKFYVSAAYSQFLTGRNTLTTNFVSVSVGWDIL